MLVTGEGVAVAGSSQLAGSASWFSQASTVQQIGLVVDRLDGIDYWRAAWSLCGAINWVGRLSAS